MFQTDDDTVIVGAAELRSEAPKLISFKKVIVTKRGNPVAVLQNYDEYKEKEELIETFEDLVLGYLAKERADNSKDSDFVDEDSAKKALGL